MQKSIHGYLLLPVGAIPDYQGVNRRPFEIEIIHEEITVPLSEWDSELIWIYYPPGWRQDAYRLLEENMNRGPYPLDDLELIADYEVATEIRALIEPHLGPYEVVECHVWELGDHPVTNIELPAPTLGYDVAYPGGDYFSAIRDGLSNHPTWLHEMPSAELRAKYLSLLNEYGLFPTPEPITEYMNDFWKVTPYEATRDYAVYWLNRRVD